MVVALAAMALVVVNSLKASSWGVFSIACTIPIALGMGLWSYKLRPGSLKAATVVGVVLLLVAVGLGRWVQQSPFHAMFVLRVWDKTRDGLNAKAGAIKNAINQFTRGNY